MATAKVVKGEKAWLVDVGTGTVIGWHGGRSDETGNGKFRNGKD